MPSVHQLEVLCSSARKNLLRAHSDILYGYYEIARKLLFGYFLFHVDASGHSK